MKILGGTLRACPLCGDSLLEKTRLAPQVRPLKNFPKETETMKLNDKRIIAWATALALILISSFNASLPQAQQQPLSPRRSAEMELNGKKLSVDYGSPRMRGRKIMGELVPYDRVWRTGANKATHFTTEADLIIGNVTVPKGTYTLFTLPSQKGWKLIINKRTGQWGIPYTADDEKQELARIDMKVETLSAPLEEFTISLEKAGDGGILKLEWETTRASVAFKEKK